MYLKEQAMQPTLDLTILANLREFDRAGDVSIVEELIDLFLLNTNPLLEVLEKTLANHDQHTFRITLHRLKGSSASIGGLQLSHLCAELETLVSAGLKQHIDAQLVRVTEEYQRLAVELEHERLGYVPQCSRAIGSGQ